MAEVLRCAPPRKSVRRPVQLATATTTSAIFLAFNAIVCVSSLRAMCVGGVFVVSSLVAGGGMRSVGSFGWLSC